MLQFLYSVFVLCIINPLSFLILFCIVYLPSDSFNVNVLCGLRISWYGDRMECGYLYLLNTWWRYCPLKRLTLNRTAGLYKWVCVCVCVCVCVEWQMERNWVSQKQMIHAISLHRSSVISLIFTQLKREIEYVCVLWSKQSAVCRLFWNIITVNSLKSVFTK